MASHSLVSVAGETGMSVSFLAPGAGDVLDIGEPAGGKSCDESVE